MLAITSPSSPTHTHSTVMVVVAASNASSVDLVLDGAPLATIAAPFTYSWDTTTVPEGLHALVARTEGEASEPVAVVVDRTPPRVIERSPELDSNDGAAEGPYVLAFDEAIDPASVSPQSIVLSRDGLAIAATTVLSADGTQLAITPSAPLDVPVELELAISPSGNTIRDLAGNAVAYDRWRFSLATWRRLGDKLGSNAAASYYGEIAIGADNLPVVVWQEQFASTYRGGLLYARKWDGTGWTALGGALNQDATHAASWAKVAIDPQNRPIVAFGEDNATGNYDLFVERWNGVSWQLLGPGALDIAISDETKYPSFAFDSSGNPWIGFQEGVLNGPVTYYVMSFDGVSWNRVASGVTEPADYYRGISLALNRSDVPTIAIGDPAGIKVFQLAGGAWTPLGPPIVERAGDPTYSLNLALDATDVPVVAFSERDIELGDFNAYVARYDAATGRWPLLGSALDYDVAKPAYYPNLARRPDGSLVAVWNEEVGAETLQRFVVRAALWTGTYWQPVGSVVAPDPTTSVNLSSVAVGSDGVPVVAFGEYDIPDYFYSSVVAYRFNGLAGTPYGISAYAPSTTCSLPAGAVPSVLSATGCFEGYPLRVPVAGVVPYDLNAPLWSDGDLKRRWLVVPAGTSIGFTETGAWDFPIGTILIKEFSLDAVADDPATNYAIETRFLVKRGAMTWQGYSYKWRRNQSDADLQPDLASTDTYTSLVAGIPTIDTHTFPSQGQCLVCHNATAGFALGLQTGNLNRPADYGAAVDNQLRALAHAGVLSGLGATDPGTLPRFARPRDIAEPVYERARSYMSANCSQCHRAGGLMPSPQLPYEVDLPTSALCAELVPGSAATSKLYLKVTSTPTNPPATGGAPMPPLARLTVDPVAQVVIGDWINGIKTCP